MAAATPQPERGERALIRRLGEELGPAARCPAGVPFGDDMAGVPDTQPPLLATTDMLMDGVDFESARHAWEDVGWKAMAVNLSDCAAMAAAPVAALAAVALSRHLSMDDALALLRGVRACGERYGCPLVGGDTNSWDSPTVIAITVLARPEPGRAPVRRDGARPGDAVYVTGPLGGSILGRHLRPEPRLDTALALNRTLAPHAMIDISDGLAVDLHHILDASGCGAVIDAAALAAVVHPDAERLARQDGMPATAHAWQDGEDFELIVVLPPDADAAAVAALDLRPLGRITTERGLRLVHADGRIESIAPRGWEHFR
jgi:thiamine-monophosphate kinase